MSCLKAGQHIQEETVNKRPLNLHVRLIDDYYSKNVTRSMQAVHATSLNVTWHMQDDGSCSIYRLTDRANPFLEYFYEHPKKTSPAVNGAT